MTNVQKPNNLAALSDDLAAAVEQVSQAIVAINARRRISSSGILWRPDLIVTADHTIRREEEISITLPNGQTQSAVVIGRDPGTDLAVLKVAEAVGEPMAHLADATALKIGHFVLGVGRSSERGVIASFGIINALAGNWRTWHGGTIEQFIQLDLMLYPGLAGGALVNPQGEILGLLTSGPRDMVLVIPALTLNRVVTQLTERGRIARGYLGIGMQPVRLPKPLLQSLELAHPGGVIIVTLEPEGPAEQAGVLIGDILIALDDRPIADTSDVQAALDPERIGQPITAHLIRGGHLTQVTITVGERPDREG